MIKKDKYEYTTIELFNSEDNTSELNNLLKKGWILEKTIKLGKNGSYYSSNVLYLKRKIKRHKPN